MKKTSKNKFFGFILALLLIPFIPHGLEGMEECSDSTTLDRLETTILFERIVREGPTLLVKLLNERYDFKTARDCHGRTLAHHLASWGTPELIQLFMSFYSHCTVWVDKQKNTIFHLALERPSLFQAVMAQRNGAHGINSQNSHGHTPLFLAVSLQLPNEVRQLLEAGAHITPALVELAIKLAAVSSAKMCEANAIVALLLSHATNTEVHAEYINLGLLELANQSNNPQLVNLLYHYLRQAGSNRYPVNIVPIMIIPYVPTIPIFTPKSQYPESNEETRSHKKARIDEPMPSSDGEIFYLGLPSWRSLRQAAHETERFKSAFQNDSASFDQILAEQLQVNLYRDRQGRSLAHYLVMHDNISALERLLNQYGAEGMPADYEGNNPAHIAAQRGLHHFVTLIFERLPALIEQPNRAGQTPRTILENVAFTEHNIDETVPTQNPSSNLRDDDTRVNDIAHYEAPFGESFRRYTQGVFESSSTSFTELNEVIDLTGEEVESPSDAQVYQTTQDSPQLLSVSTLLHQAVLNNNLNAVRSILAQPSANPNEREDTNGWTPLHLAAILGYHAIAQLLILDQRTDITITDNFNRDALSYLLARPNSTNIPLYEPVQLALNLESQCQSLDL